MKFSRVLATLACMMLAPAALAEHLGALGPTYAIGEESALDLIQRRLQEKERTGELQRLQEEAQRRVQLSLKHPKPVVGIGTVEVRTQRLLDPTVTYTHAVTDEDGRILVPAGTRINPLEIMPLSKRLVFFDGRDKTQVRAVKRLVQQQGRRVKPILVAGSWLDLTKQWKTQVYYDQHGVLSQRFGIALVPTIVSARGTQLLLEEIPVKELR